MSPVVPHFCAQCLEDLNYDKEELLWPIIDKKFLKDNEVNIVVQINGKKRSLAKTKLDLNESEIMKIIKDDPTMNKYLDNEKIKKTIYIKNKLINIII